MGTSDRLGFGCGLAMGTILGQGSTVTRLNGTCRGSSSEPRVAGARGGGWGGGEKGRAGDIQFTNPDWTQGVSGGRKLSPDRGARGGREGAGIHRLVSAFGDQVPDIVRRHHISVHDHSVEVAGKDQLPPRTRSPSDDRSAVERGRAREGHAGGVGAGRAEEAESRIVRLLANGGALSLEDQSKQRMVSMSVRERERELLSRMKSSIVKREGARDLSEPQWFAGGKGVRGAGDRDGVNFGATHSGSKRYCGLLEARESTSLGLLPQKCVLTTHTFPGPQDAEGQCGGDANVTRIDSSCTETQMVRHGAAETQSKSRRTVTKVDGGGAVELMAYLSELCARPAICFSEKTPPVEQVCPA